MAYKYADRSPVAGDVVECVTTNGNPDGKTAGKLYITLDGVHYMDDTTNECALVLVGTNWKILDTLPGEQITTGDTVICTAKENSIYGKVVTISGTDNDYIYWDHGDHKNVRSKFLILQKTEDEPTKELAITDHIIDIAGSTLQDRLKLRQVLLDNGQEMYISRFSRNFYQEEFDLEQYPNIISQPTWGGSRKEDSATITLADFIRKYQQSNKLHNLAFYKRSGEDWTKEEYSNLFTLVGDTCSHPIGSANKWVFPDEGECYYNWASQSDDVNFDNCTQVAYEALDFPSAVSVAEVPKPPMRGIGTVNTTEPIPSSRYVGQCQEIPFLDEPVVRKFKVGDTIRAKYDSNEYLIIGITEDRYLHPNDFTTFFNVAHGYELVSAAGQDAPEQAVEVGSTWIRNETICSDKPAGELITITSVTGEKHEHPRYIVEWGTASYQTPAYVLKTFTKIESTTTETSEPTITKENTMALIQYTDEEIKAAMTGKKCKKAAKQKSDYKLRPALVAIYHTDKQSGGSRIESVEFSGKSAHADAQAHLATMLAEHPNASMTPYVMGKSSKIKHNFKQV